MEESRKWGLYYITNLLFKTYFRVKVFYHGLVYMVLTRIQCLAQLYWSLQEHTPRNECIPGRHALSLELSQIARGHLSVLRWAHPLPRGELQQGSRISLLTLCVKCATRPPR